LTYRKKDKRYRRKIKVGRLTTLLFIIEPLPFQQQEEQQKQEQQQRQEREIEREGNNVWDKIPLDTDLGLPSREEVEKRFGKIPDD
jgi:hypothetical protein